MNTIEKINCAYCSYGNGVLGYAREIGSRTEQYWCPIKHARRVIAAQERYNLYADYGDAAAHRSLINRPLVSTPESAFLEPGIDLDPCKKPIFEDRTNAGQTV